MFIFLLLTQMVFRKKKFKKLNINNLIVFHLKVNWIHHVNNHFLFNNLNYILISVLLNVISITINSLNKKCLKIFNGLRENKLSNYFY